LLREAVYALQENDIGLLGWAIDNLDAALALSEPSGEERIGEEPPFRHGLYETERYRLAAVAAAARNDTRAAIELCRRAAMEARASGLTTQLVFALYDLVRYGEGPAAAAELVDATAGLEGELFSVLAETATALTRADGEALDVATERLSAMGFGLFAAEAARTASHVHARAALRARAAASHRRAEELAAECQGASTPLLRVDSQESVDPLTARERDIAQLAAAGRSNADIADQLGLSVRTVETHLQRVYTKLGIHGRAELATAFPT
jgi:DNA-binding CsgD family transcriptional regulator